MDLKVVDDLVPTVGHANKLSEVRQAEWDLVVTDGFDQACRVPSMNKYAAAEPHLCVISFEDIQGGKVIEREIQRGTSRFDVTIASGKISNEFVVPDSLPSDVDALVTEQLVPMMRQRGGKHLYYYVNHPGTFINPFVSTPEGAVLAGWYERKSDTSETWLLPADTPNKQQWILAALRRWHERWPDRFPPVHDWHQNPTWMTVDEAELWGAIVELRAERERVTAELTIREEGLSQQLGRVRADADANERLLLTAKGDPLVEATAVTLEELGFVVERSDEVAEHGHRLEDLRVSDPAQADWVSLVEVRGYAGGAKVNDLLRLSRHTTEFVAATGRYPDSQWYVINQFIGRDPSTRPAPLAADDASLNDWGGLAIDTADLFRVLMAVRHQRIDPDSVRAELRIARGRWVFDPPAPE